MKKLTMALFAALICIAAAAQEQRHPLDDLETVYKDENVTFRKMDDHTWMGSGNVMSSETMYIVEGKRKAVLIDAGTVIPGLDKIVAQITKKPVTLILTHVHPVYLIGLMGVEIDHPDKEYWKDRYISEYTFREKGSHDLLGETIVIIFAELTRFQKAEDECVTLEDKLLYLLKNSGKMNTPPKWATEKPCKDLLDAFEIGDFSRTKREQYDKDMYDEKRRNGELAAAREDGIAEGLAQGHAEGLAEGRAEAKIEMANKFKALGVDIDTIVQATGLDRDAVEKL